MASERRFDEEALLSESWCWIVARRSFQSCKDRQRAGGDDDVAESCANGGGGGGGVAEDELVEERRSWCGG